MSFLDQWRNEAEAKLIECARLALDVADIDLHYRLMVVGLLWPIRRPVQDFELEAMQAVQEVVGDKSKFVMQLVQSWGDDPLAVAETLTTPQLQSGELGAALNTLLSYFGAFSIFAGQTERRVESTAIRPRVLVFYAAGDGEALALEIYQKLQVEGVSTWPDLSQLEHEETWWMRITEALDQVEFLVLAMSAAATTSPHARRVWRYAYQHRVCIYPVFKDNALNFAALPRWIQQIHFYNLNREWPKLINDLKDECRMPETIFMAEALPGAFVPRPVELQQVISYLYDSERDEAVTGVVVLAGAGGYGKSTLAQAICHNEYIRQVFDNGILWVTLGENPGDLSRHIINLIEKLSGERPGFTGLDTAVARLGELLADRDILMVIDDVWNVAHLKPFLRGGSRCARLITTRHIAIAPPGAKIAQVGAMRQNEAVALLAGQLPAAEISVLQELANRLGQWPLLLKLANGTLRDRVYKQQQTLPQALAYVNEALDRRGLTAFDAGNPSERNQAVSQTISMSLDLLDPTQRARYHELAIFPEDENIPLAALETLWSATGGFDDFDTEELVDHLRELSLLLHVDLSQRYARQHKVLHAYLTFQQAENLAALHSQFLDAYRPQAGWADMSPQEPYLWTHLAYHLIAAGRGDELLGAVKDLRYLAAKAYLRGAYQAEHDLLLAENLAPNDDALRPLRRILSQTAHLLIRCESAGEAINTLHSRLNHLPELAAMAAAAEATVPRPLLTARHMLPDLPDPHLIRTLRGHTAGVMDCALSADGSLAVAVGKDNTITVWEIETGIQRFSLLEEQSDVWGCAISGDGSTLAYCTSNGYLTLVDIQNETQPARWPAHPDSGVVDCALSYDGSVVVTASKDKTLKVWDRPGGSARFTLTGHQRTVTDCDISADGLVIVSASNDGTLRVWDALTGRQRFAATIRLTEEGLDRLTFSSQRDLSFYCALSADGSIGAATSSAGAVTVWNATDGTELLALSGDKRGVQGCALNEDGSTIACAFNSGAVKVWNTITGVELLNLSDHSRPANSCAISNNGAVIISASDDQTLKVWDGRPKSALLSSLKRIGAAQSCAISADGNIAVTAMADNSLIVWDVFGGNPLATLTGHTRKIIDCALTPDGKILVSASQDQTVKVWDAQSGRELRTLAGHTWAVNGCAISDDGAVIVSASDDKLLKIWDGDSGEERLSIAAHLRQVNHCAVSADGRRAISASGDNTLRVWGLPDGSQQATLRGHTAWVSHCALSADGSTLVSASYDKTLKVWDADNYRERLTLRGHTMTVAGCAITATGRLVVSVGRDKMVKVWDAATGACLTTLYVEEALFGCACSGDGASIVAVGANGVYFLRLVR
jgi:WD40 repeat protein